MSDIFDTEVSFDKDTLILKKCKCIVCFDDKAKCAVLYPKETGILRITTQNDINNIVTALMNTPYNTIKTPLIEIKPEENLDFYNLTLDTSLTIPGIHLYWYKSPNWDNIKTEILEIIDSLSEIALFDEIHMHGSDYCVSNCKIHSQFVKIHNNSYKNIEIIMNNKYKHHSIDFVNIGPNEELKINQVKVYKKMNPVIRLFCNDWISQFRTKKDLRKTLEKYFPNFVGTIQYCWDASYVTTNRFNFNTLN